MSDLRQYASDIDSPLLTQILVAGQRISKADIDAGNRCFGPNLNKSGYSGYAFLMYYHYINN